jgi:hypothetical protein
MLPNERPLGKIGLSGKVGIDQQAEGIAADYLAA